MGTEHAKHFLLHIEAHAELQAKLAAAGWNPEFISGFASELGYRFNSQEFQGAIDALWGSLSEDELLNVAGGGGNGGGGVTNPDVVICSNNQPAAIVNGQPWCPPPGDVSGNSCFFGRSR
jgi:predicted ribosomally synthesized peptide with nif11-like leader